VRFRLQSLLCFQKILQKNKFETNFEVEATGKRNGSKNINIFINVTIAGPEHKENLTVKAF
jgi:hypothetical protein